MTTDKLTSLLQSRFGEAVRITHLEAKEWFLDSATGQTWQNHLQTTIARRLAGSAKRDVDPNVIKESESFLGHIEKLTSANKLYSFSASAEKRHFAGWAVDDHIVFCLPDTIQN